MLSREALQVRLLSNSTDRHLLIFEARLNVQIGDIVDSETDLQNDLRYTFRAIGWYLGIIYKFLVLNRYIYIL